MSGIKFITRPVDYTSNPFSPDEEQAMLATLTNRKAVVIQRDNNNRKPHNAVEQSIRYFAKKHRLKAHIRHAGENEIIVWLEK